MGSTWPTRAPKTLAAVAVMTISSARLGTARRPCTMARRSWSRKPPLRLAKTETWFRVLSRGAPFGARGTKVGTATVLTFLTSASRAKAAVNGATAPPPLGA